MDLSLNTVIVFDLDDTLYKEINFLKSGYARIALEIKKQICKDVHDEMLNLYYNKEPVFDKIKSKYSLSMSIEEMVNLYRYHKPNINLSKGVIEILNLLRNNKIKLGLITDGRSITQRNKIEALGLIDFFNEVIISEEVQSEKPNLRNYTLLENKIEGENYIYIADNFNKDFISPNFLNWITIGIIDDGDNIHKTNLNLAKEYYPQFKFENFCELKDWFIKKKII